MSAGNWVLLRAGALRLLLPQSDVGAAEYLEARPVPDEIPGLLRSADPQEPRVFAALSDGMTLLDECPPQRFVACMLAGGADQVVWCWDELRVLIALELRPLDVPRALLTPSSPAPTYVELGGEPAFLCTGADLSRYAMQPLEATHAA